MNSVKPNPLGGLLQQLYDEIRPRCGICGQRMARQENCLAALRNNWCSSGCGVAPLEPIRAVCPSCAGAQQMLRCAWTGAAFPAFKNAKAELTASGLVENFVRYLPEDHRTAPLSPAGLEQVRDCYQRAAAAMEHWLGHTKGEFLHGCRIVRRVGLLRVEARFKDVAEVERALCIRTLLCGGNGVIKFFWQRQIDEKPETYIRGYGPQGRPWYGTRTIRTEQFGGHAVAVLAEPRAGGWSVQRVPPGVLCLT